MRVRLPRACKTERPPRCLAATDSRLLFTRHSDSLSPGPQTPSLGVHFCISRRAWYVACTSEEPCLRSCPLAACSNDHPTTKRSTRRQLVTTHFVLLDLAQLHPKCCTGTASLLRLPCTPAPAKQASLDIAGPRSYNQYCLVLFCNLDFRAALSATAKVPTCILSPTPVQPLHARAGGSQVQPTDWEPWERWRLSGMPPYSCCEGLPQNNASCSLCIALLAAARMEQVVCILGTASEAGSHAAGASVSIRNPRPPAQKI